MMEAVQTAETLVNSYQSTRRYNPEDSHLLSVVSKLLFVIRNMLCQLLFFHKPSDVNAVLPYRQYGIFIGYARVPVCGPT
jgi:hypothetical protein